MRRITAVMCVAVLASCKPSVGGRCGPDGKIACHTATTGFMCVHGKWEQLSCGGRGGCDDQYERAGHCSNDTNDEGDPCNWPNATVCGSDLVTVLGCEDEHWRVVERCMGDKRCPLMGHPNTPEGPRPLKCE